MSVREPQESQSAHPGKSDGASKIASVRTKKRSVADASVEFRLPAWLKKAAQEKAEAANSSLSNVLVNYLRDYVAGDLSARRPAPAARQARHVQLAELRRMQVEQLSILSDLKILGERPDSPLATAACASLLNETVQTARASFRLLRHVS